MVQEQRCKCLLEGKYLYNHKVLPDIEKLSNILWAHPDLVKLFNTFPTCLSWIRLTKQTNVDSRWLNLLVRLLPKDLHRIICLFDVREGRQLCLGITKCPRFIVMSRGFEGHCHRPEPSSYESKIGKKR
jgi:hypothetical protein